MDSRDCREVSVLVVDDHPGIREMLASLLRTAGLQVLGEAADGLEALQQCQLLHPDVVVLDIAMPRMNGFESAREMARTVPATKIVFVTNHISDEYVRAALEIGGAGFVSKKDAAKGLLEAIEAVLDGHTYVLGEVSSANVKL